MFTIALYADGNGEHQKCLIEHDDNLSLADVDLKDSLPNYNEGSTLFLISMDTIAGDQQELHNLTITDGYGQEVTEHSIKLV